MLDDPRHVGVFDGALLLLLPFADVVEEQRVAVDLHVIAADGRQSVRRLVLRALLVADPEEALVDETDDRRHHALPVRLIVLQVGAHAAAQLGERFAEFDDVLELRLLALRAEAVVIAVLNAALLVDADGLQRRAVAAGDAHIPPRRRDAQLGDARERLLVFDAAAVGVEIGEPALLPSLAADAVKVEMPPPPHRLSGHVRSISARSVP